MPSFTPERLHSIRRRKAVARLGSDEGAVAEMGTSVASTSAVTFEGPHASALEPRVALPEGMPFSCFCASAEGDDDEEGEDVGEKLEVAMVVEAAGDVGNTDADADEGKACSFGDGLYASFPLTHDPPALAPSPPSSPSPSYTSIISILCALELELKLKLV